MKLLKHNLLEEVLEFFLIFAVVAGVWVFISFSLKEKPQTILAEQANLHQSDPIDLSTTDKINQYLKATDISYKRRQFELELEKAKFAEGFEQAKLNQLNYDQRKNEWGIDLSQEDIAAKVSRELAQKDGTKFLKNSPEDRIEAKIKNRQFIAEYDKNFRKQFIEEFLDNAQEAGYEVELDDDLQIIKFRPIAKKNPVLFNQ